MFKCKYICVIFYIIMCTSRVLGHEMYSPLTHHYLNSGMYERTPRKEVRLYKNDYDRNQQECTEYYCYIRDYNMPNCNGYGYKIERSKRYGTTSYVWQDFMGIRERVRCHKLDGTPIITDLHDFTDKRKSTDKLKD